MQPKVSVIIPVYNTERYLPECLDSVVNQTLREIEIICVDDGSTDGSLEILREYEARDGRVKVLTQENINAGAARNHGLRHATGEYLSFLDSDDFFHREMLEKAFRQAKEAQADICVFQAEGYDNRNGLKYPLLWACKPELCHGDRVAFSWRTNLPNLYWFTTLAPWNKLFRTAFVRENGLVFQEIRNANDLAFVMTALSVAERITPLYEVLVTYRMHNSASLQGSKDTAPLCFYDALREVKRRLEELEIFDDQEALFHDKALSTCIGHLLSLKTIEAFERVFYFLRDTAFPELGLSDTPKSCFLHSGEKKFDQMEDIMKLSAIEFAKKYRLFGCDGDDLRASWSYRIGCAVTWLPRMIVGGIRCYRENGLRYTLYRIRVKYGTKCMSEAISERKRA